MVNETIDSIRKAELEGENIISDAKLKADAVIAESAAQREKLFLDAKRSAAEYEKKTLAAAKISADGIKKSAEAEAAEKCSEITATAEKKRLAAVKRAAEIILE